MYTKTRFEKLKNKGRFCFNIRIDQNDYWSPVKLATWRKMTSIFFISTIEIERRTIKKDKHKRICIKKKVLLKVFVTLAYSGYSISANQTFSLVVLPVQYNTPVIPKGNDSPRIRFASVGKEGFLHFPLHSVFFKLHS